MRKLLLIVNPCSGKAKMKTDLLSVVQILSDKGFEVTVYPTKERGDATVKAASLKQDEYDRIVVAGGDGTLNEVLSGLMSSGVISKLGYIPAGTLNEWSSSLKIPRSRLSAAKATASNKVIDLDIGKFGEKYFSYTASFGAFTDASYSTPQNIKNVLGQAAYYLEGVKSLANIKPVHLKFKCEEIETEGDYLFGAVSNSLSVGGVVKFKENLVKLNDGLFEVCLIRKPANIIELQSIIDGILHQDLTRDGIEFFHTKEITVSGGYGLAWTLDGEFCEGNDVTVIKNIPSALHLIVPEAKQKENK